MVGPIRHFGITIEKPPIKLNNATLFDPKHTDLSIKGLPPPAMKTHYRFIQNDQRLTFGHRGSWQPSSRHGLQALHVPWHPSATAFTQHTAVDGIGLIQPARARPSGLTTFHPAPGHDCHDSEHPNAKDILEMFRNWSIYVNL